MLSGGLLTSEDHVNTLYNFSPAKSTLASLWVFLHIQASDSLPESLLPAIQSHNSWPLTEGRCLCFSEFHPFVPCAGSIGFEEVGMLN